MSLKFMKESKPLKLARYGIDILAVYSSPNEVPVPIDVAMTKIHELLSKKVGTARLRIQKCILQIWGGNNGSHMIIIKSHSTKKVLESFTTKSMGIPQIGQLATQDLVFLPVLNKDQKSELFIFHPNSVSAQEVVIKLIKLIQIKEGEIYPSSPIPSLTQQQSQTEQTVDPATTVFKHVNNVHIKENNSPDEDRSDYSLSSTFFNNWYCKVEQMVSNTPTSLYQNSEYGSSINDELHLLNQYLKEIRGFMNYFYDIMHKSIRDENIQNNSVQRSMKLPSKPNFVEIIQKIKYSLNLSAVHEAVIANPNAKEIINQLLLILRILSDATIDKRSHRSELVKEVRDPLITETTARYLMANLNTSNRDFWITLGENYGHLELRNINPLGLHRTLIDEFELKRDILKPNYDHYSHRITDRNNDRSSYRSYEKGLDVNYERQPYISHNRNYGNNYSRPYNSDNDTRSEDNYSKRMLTLSQPQIYKSERGRSPTDFDDDLIYRSYPRIEEPDRSFHRLPAPTMLMHQKSDRIIPIENGYGHHDSSTWNNLQTRFIDVVKLRNGRLMKITRNRSAQNNREIAVSCNEAVELLTDYGDMLMVKNALGEVGYCPSLIAEPMPTPY